MRGQAITTANAGPAAAGRVLRDPVSVLALALALVSGILLGLGSLDLQVQLAICWALLAVAHVALLRTAGRIAARSTDRARRWIWGGIAAAGGLYAIGDALQLGLLASRPLTVAEGLGVSAQSALVLVGTAVPLVAVLLLTPTFGHRPRRPRARFLLDVSIVMIAATVLGVHLMLPASGPVAAGVWFGLLIGPGLFLSVVLGIATIVRSGRSPMSRWAAVVLAGAATLEAGAQAAAPVLVRADRVEWHLGLTLLASALLLLSAATESRRPASARPLGVAQQLPLITFLPYVALLATLAVLLRVLWAELSGVQPWVVVLGAVVSSVLVVWRQVIVIADNNRLVDVLDAKVDELNALLAERDRLTVALRHEASHDPLTRLANRVLLGQRLDAALGRLTERPGRLTLMIIDLDDFKLVNDELGHAAGDGVLTSVAGRIRSCVRDDDLVARLGGDEFAVLLEDLGGDEKELARRIGSALAAPIALAEGTVTVEASIGVATTRDPSGSAESLLRAADVAMYEVKRSRAVRAASTSLVGSPAPDRGPRVGHDAS
ncbi:diguanylate cyclase domain-containing protein [Actinotalea sp.]|uniref:diguanylate cyclase domain-containing protein n=1 Tax=Actinotalea sp. TaxID=1872145 RepID=UPI0035624B28